MCNGLAAPRDARDFRPLPLLGRQSSNQIQDLIDISANTSAILQAFDAMIGRFGIPSLHQSETPQAEWSLLSKQEPPSCFGSFFEGRTSRWRIAGVLRLPIPRVSFFEIRLRKFVSDSWVNCFNASLRFAMLLLSRSPKTRSQISCGSLLKRSVEFLGLSIALNTASPAERLRLHDLIRARRPGVATRYSVEGTWS